MKKKTVFLLLIALAALVFSTATVMASPLDPAPAAKPTQEKTPHGKSPAAPASGQDKHEVKDTEKAEQHDARQAEKDARLAQAGKKLHFKGTVAGVGAGSLTLLLADGTSVEFTLTRDSIIKVPTLGLFAAWEDLLPGMKANVQAVDVSAGQAAAVQDPAVEQPASTLTVLKVLVIPGKPIKTHRVGLVTAYEAGVSITIEEKDHKLYTYQLTADTAILPVEPAGQVVVGARVTVVVVSDLAGGPGTALAVVVHPSTACDVPDPAADPVTPETCPPSPPEPEE